MDKRLNSSVYGLLNFFITAETEGMFRDFTDKFFEKMDFYEASFENQLQAQGEEFETELNSRKDALITGLVLIRRILQCFKLMILIIW